MRSAWLSFVIGVCLVGSSWAGPVVAPRTLQLDDGMPLIVTPVVDITSATDEPNQLIEFSLVQDCKVDGVVLIPKGTLVNGKIEKAQHSKMFGKQGVLEVSFNDTKAVDGSVLLVRTTVDRKGNVARTTMDKVTSILPYGVGMVFNGKDAVLPAGTPLTIFIDGTSKFRIVSGKKPAMVPTPALTTKP